MVCRVVAEEWRTLEACPELLPLPDEPSVLEHLPSAPRRSAPFVAYALAAVLVCFLVATAGVVRRKVVPPSAPPATTAKEVSPATLPDPAATPGQPTGRGAAIAARVLDRYPKLKVAVISGIRFPKPDGIELYGTGAFGASISFILPEEAWDALGEDEKLDLQAYVAGKVAWVRDHAEDYMIVPRSAPDYGPDIERARHLVDGAWRIGSTQTYPDDPDGNLYFKRILRKGPAY